MGTSIHIKAVPKSLNRVGKHQKHFNMKNLFSALLIMLFAWNTSQAGNPEINVTFVGDAADEVGCNIVVDFSSTSAPLPVVLEPNTTIINNFLPPSINYYYEYPSTSSYDFITPGGTSEPRMICCGCAVLTIFLEYHVDLVSNTAEIIVHVNHHENLMCEDCNGSPSGPTDDGFSEG